MRVSRLFVSVELLEGKQIELPDESAHYVRTVLRLKKDQEITLFNGQGGEYLGRLVEVSRKKVSIEVQNHSGRSVESELNVILGLGISRGDRMDWAVQKSVELGVNQITPLLTNRCVIKLKEDKKQHRLQHWRNIAQHAAEQSCRTFLPDMPEITGFKDWVTKQQGLKVFLDPYGECSLAELQPEKDLVTILSGPEGGFTEQERVIAKTAGFIPVRLGNRILRTETAALAALSALQMLWGDFR